MKFAWFSTKAQFERNMSDELRDHIDRQVAANIAAGMTPNEARRQATLQLGAMEGVKENCREERRGFWLERMWADIRYGIRVLRKNPAFATVAILTIALGIGPTSAVFSVVDRLLFRSLPYPQDDRLVSVGLMAPITDGEFMLAMDFVEWRRTGSPFTSMASTIPGSRDCDFTDQNPVRMACAQVDANFLPTLGIQPIFGRNFTPEENRPHTPRVALLSYGVWKSRYGGDPKIVGRSVALDGQSTQIVGVLPAEFEMPTLTRADLLMPEVLDEAGMRRDGPQLVLRAFARMKPGVTVRQAQAALQLLFEESMKFVPSAFRSEVHLSVRSLRDRQIASAKVAAWVLLGSVIAVLLLASTNVANLLLGLAAARQRETAVRAALGASAKRLARQALTESLLLSLLGGLAGCWIAYGLLRLFLSIAPEGIPRLQQATLDGRVLLFTLGVAVASGLLFGLAPLLRKPALDILAGKNAQPIERSPLRQILVTSQIAVSLVLLTGASLLLRSLWKLQSVPLGMDAEHVVGADLTLAAYRYPQEPQQRTFFEQLMQRLKQVPGIGSMALSDSLPPSGGMEATIFSNIEVAGRPRPAQGTGGMVGWRAVTPGYFSTLGIAILNGRAFLDRDLFAGENSVILDDALAQRLFPNGDGLGKSMRFGQSGPWRTIVGVVADVRNNGLEGRSDPEFYIPWKDDPQIYYGTAHVIIRTPVNADTMAKWVRSEVASVDPSQPVTIATMSERVSKLADRPRFDAVLLSLFGALGVCLAAIGMYGVVAFLVTQRTREIGVRMALGANRRDVLKLVLGHVVRWTAAGALLGLVGSWFASQLIRSLLFEVSVHDRGCSGSPWRS